MIEKRIYICSTCEKPYEKKEQAEYCEAEHLRPKEIICARYSKAGRGYRIPDLLTVKFSDDSVEYYRLDQPEVDDEEFDFS